MRTIRINDTGEDVVCAQNALNAHGANPSLKPDGVFGRATQSAVEAFQRVSGLYDDGVVGPATWRALGFEREQAENVIDAPSKMRIDRLVADVFGAGYAIHKLREDAAEAYLRVYAETKMNGAVITSSGSLRALTADVGSNRSATSLHYLGLALDLFVHSGMNRPLTDPYVVTKGSEPRSWVVFARATRGKIMTLKAWDHRSQSEIEVRDRFINLTEIMDKHGFKPIPARRSYSKSNYGGAEWWHFQFEKGLEKGTTFGIELLKIYTPEDLKDTPPFSFRNAVWQKDFF